jgi:hypothetical protein
MRRGVQHHEVVALPLRLLQRRGEPGRAFHGDIDGRAAGLAAVSPARGGGLRVQVQQDDTAAGCGGLDREMQRQRGFAGSALLA